MDVAMNRDATVRRNGVGAGSIIPFVLARRDKSRRYRGNTNVLIHYYIVTLTFCPILAYLYNHSNWYL